MLFRRLSSLLRAPVSLYDEICNALAEAGNGGATAILNGNLPSSALIGKHGCKPIL